MTKRRHVLTAALLASAGIATLGSASTSAETIALVQINQQALFFTQMNEGAQTKADELGVELVIFNANNDPAAQNNAIETYIAQEVDGLVVVAIDTNGIMPAVQQAADAGIPVVAVDAILPDGPQVAQVGVDNAAAGAMIGEHFLDYVEKEMGGEAKLGVVGALNSTIQNVRQEGFEDVVADADGITMAGVVDGRNVQDNAMSAAENLMTANPDLSAIYATGEPALLGAVAAVESQGRQDFGARRRLGPDGGGDQGHRRRLRRRRRPAGSGRHGCCCGRGCAPGDRRRDRRGRDLGAGHHRHLGQRRRVPGDLRVMSDAVGETQLGPPLPGSARPTARRHRGSRSAASRSASARSRRCAASISPSGPARWWAWSATTPPASRR